MSDVSHHFNERAVEPSRLKYVPNSLTTECHGSGELVPWIMSAMREMEPGRNATKKSCIHR